MRNDTFMNKSKCEFSISSKTFSPDRITEELNIQPNKTSKIGDIVTSKYSNSVGKKNYHSWSISSDCIFSDKEDITNQIKQVQFLLRGKESTIVKYKSDVDTEIIFYIWIETEDAGIGIDLSADQLSFISSISTRLHFTIITNNEVLNKS